MRADRLLSILLLLQTKGRLTARELAEQLEVSERTIYRDLDALSSAGIPIYTECGPGGGAALVDGYQTRLTGLTEAEVRALFLFNVASPLVDLGLGNVLDDALLKLSAALPPSSRSTIEQVRQRFHLDAAWWHHTEDATLHLDTIQKALWHDSVLRLTYSEEDGLQSEQRVEPYGLVAKARVWYLVGTTQGHMRVWRVSRIQSATVLDERFVRPTDFDLSAYWTAWCKQRESNHPDYAVPLRIAPDELPSLEQALRQCGYRIVPLNKEKVYSYPQQRRRISSPQKKEKMQPRRSARFRLLQQKKRLSLRQKEAFHQKKQNIYFAA
jgi:predicted DNA-binding transcriptional regulator YafY